MVNFNMSMPQKKSQQKASDPKSKRLMNLFTNPKENRRGDEN